jgi:hypothetical protein
MFMKKIMTNMGIPESIAGLAAGAGMSSIIGGLTSQIKGAGDTDDIDASSLMSVLGGGGGAMDMLGKAAGMLGGFGENSADKAGDAGNAAGGLADKAKDLLGGFFGK